MSAESHRLPFSALSLSFLNFNMSLVLQIGPDLSSAMGFGNSGRSSLQLVTACLLTLMHCATS